MHMIKASGRLNGLRNLDHVVGDGVTVMEEGADAIDLG